MVICQRWVVHVIAYIITAWIFEVFSLIVIIKMSQFNNSIFISHCYSCLCPLMATTLFASFKGFSSTHLAKSCHASRHYNILYVRFFYRSYKQHLLEQEITQSYFSQNTCFSLFIPFHSNIKHDLDLWFMQIYQNKPKWSVCVNKRPFSMNFDTIYICNNLINPLTKIDGDILCNEKNHLIKV